MRDCISVSEYTFEPLTLFVCEGETLFWAYKKTKNIFVYQLQYSSPLADTALTGISLWRIFFQWRIFLPSLSLYWIHVFNVTAYPLNGALAAVLNEELHKWRAKSVTVTVTDNASTNNISCQSGLAPGASARQTRHQSLPVIHPPQRHQQEARWGFVWVTSACLWGGWTEEKGKG